MHIQIRFLSFALVAAIGFALLPEDAHSDVTVRYDLTARRYLGGVSELKRSKYFNIHTHPSYGVLERKDLQFLKEHGVGFGRAFNGPFWFFPGEKSLKTPFPTDKQAAILSRAVTDLYETQVTYPYRNRRLIITDHPYETFHMDMDIKAAAQWTVSFFRHFYNDESRPLFYEPMNEPFVHAKNFGDDDEAIRLKMSELFREIGKAFDASGMDVSILGFASAWPSVELKDFWHWDTRLKMFMDVAGEYMDGISIHLYDGTNVTGQDNRRSGANADAILDLVETYGYIKWGKVKPLAITEFGDIPKGYPEGYTPEKSSQEYRAFNHLLFGLFERQDRLLTSIPFITSKSPWYYEECGRIEPYLADLWRPDPDRVIDGKVQGYLFTKKLPFYQLWKGVSGDRTVGISDNPDIQIQSFVKGPIAFVCLNNLDDFDQRVALKDVGRPGLLKSAWIRRLSVAPREVVEYSDEPLVEEVKTITLKPYETVVLTYLYEQPIKVAREVAVTTHYCKTYLQPIETGKTIRFAFESVPENAERATVRVSIGRKPDQTKQPELKVNGKRVEVPANWPGYDQANRKDFFGAIPVPVPADALSSATEVEITFPDDGGHVSSVLLLTESPR